jgi:kynurenine formamidase
MNGRIVQINVSPGGVPKRSVPRAHVTRSGLEGDAHRDTEHHGGPDRALVIEYLVNLDRLGRDRVRFAALPLKLDGGDGAPARAIAILD